VNGHGRIEPTPVRAVLLIHQEGVLAIVALVGLSFIYIDILLRVLVR